ncbi:MAG: hypothetical protein DMD51_02145 [Gemmatimonadetes bacterium]|nr:MAG: hypothetical protein DMD32_05175 [Gemmatimonadota bacterium]PYP27615.1 MAG: hypothetical protein DMD51_02145 [Gemmatimonadota bacterium]
MGGDATRNRDDQVRRERRRYSDRDRYIRAAGHLAAKTWTVRRRARVATVGVMRLVAAGEHRVERHAARAAREPAGGGEGVERESGGASHELQVYVRAFGWRNPGWAV